MTMEADVPQQSNSQANVLTDIMVLVFRINARLLEKGDQLVAPLNLTSARWQVLGAIALAGEPLTAPSIAAAMGISRQGVQKQLNLVLKEGLVQVQPNQRHERSPLYTLTPKGQHAYDKAIELQMKWAGALAQQLEPAQLNATIGLLKGLEASLPSTPLPTLKADL